MFGEPSPTYASGPARRPSVTQAIVVRDDAALRSLITRLREAKIIAFDTETTGTDPLRATLVGIALAAFIATVAVFARTPLAQMPLYFAQRYFVRGVMLGSIK